MRRRPLLLLLCALAPIGIVTGCGGGGSAASKPPTATHTVTTPTVSLAVRLRQALVACRTLIAKSRFIPASERPVALSDCNGIKTGHIAPLRAILLQACERAVAKVPAADRPAGTVACKKVY